MTLRVILVQILVNLRSLILQLLLSEKIIQSTTKKWYGACKVHLQED